MAIAPTPTPSQATAILKAAPSIAAPPAAPGSSGINSWIPPQKFLAGGIGGIVTWLIVHLLSVYAGIDVPADLQTYIASGVAALLVYIVPPSQKDVVQHLNDDIIHIAQRDPDSNVSYVLPPVQPPPGEPATIVPPASKT